MNIIGKFGYNIIKSFIRFYLKIFLEFKVWGKNNIIEGPKIFCSNHFSSTDPFFVITLMKEPVHMIIGPGFNVPFFRKILKMGEQINALPENRKNVISTAVNYLKKNESVYIFPEGDLNDQKDFIKFYSGLARIYLEYPVPIIPIGIVSPIRYVKEKESNIKVGEVTYKTFTVLTGKYYANIGQQLFFPDYNYVDNRDEAIEKIMTLVKNSIENLVKDIKMNKFWG